MPTSVILIGGLGATATSDLVNVVGTKNCPNILDLVVNKRP